MQLEAYFDESFSNDTTKVKDNAERYNQVITHLLSTLSAIENREKANAETKLDIEKFSVFIKALSIQFLSNKELMNNKIKEPSRSIDLISNSEQIEAIQQLLRSTNSEIKKYNDIVANYSTEKRTLISSIWKYLAEKNQEIIKEFNKQSNGLQNGIKNLQEREKELRQEYVALNKKIKEANKNVTSVQPSVDEINKTLQAYGFLNFKIVSSPTEQNCYQIQREDGSIAESTLSEGEMTFITFLYFLQLAKGSTDEETITDERILVIDDPVSSLDSNVLFVVSSLLKEIIKKIKKNEGNIKQLVLLTHNVYFHKEVSFTDGGNQGNGDTFYWILRKNGTVSSAQEFGMKNPIHNSYELLWQELRNRDSNSHITAQNTMRRIIEHYFKILGKQKDDNLIEKFENSQEQEICRSLLCWINDGSHEVYDDLYVEHQEATLDKYLEVFKNIFYKMGHPEHYNMMMGYQPEQQVS
jgi:wobble nucleotide-excising tRNase